VQNTTRTARALADEVARDATEQTERSLRAQQDTARQFADPFTRPGNGAASPSEARGSDAQGSGVGQPHASGSTPAGSARGERSATH
jgi:hypothetical protein